MNAKFLLPATGPDLGAVGGSETLRAVIGALLTFGLIVALLMLIVSATAWAVGSSERIDHRIADVLEYGASHRHYFLTERVAGSLVQDGRRVLHPPERFVPVDLATDAPLLGVARERLRTPPHPRQPDLGPMQSRQHLRESMTHRPVRRAPPRDLT